MRIESGTSAGSPYALVRSAGSSWKRRSRSTETPPRRGARRRSRGAAERSRAVVVDDERERRVAHPGGHVGQPRVNGRRRLGARVVTPPTVTMSSMRAPSRRRSKTKVDLRGNGGTGSRTPDRAGRGGQTWNARKSAARSWSAIRPRARGSTRSPVRSSSASCPPGFEKPRKRQTKAPKTLIRDSGIFHALMDSLIDAPPGSSETGRLVGGFRSEQVLARFPTRDAYFWRTQGWRRTRSVCAGRNGRRIGFEFSLAMLPAHQVHAHRASRP